MGNDQGINKNRDWDIGKFGLESVTSISKPKRCPTVLGDSRKNWVRARDFRNSSSYLYISTRTKSPPILDRRNWCFYLRLIEF